jgi:hypothetical protein
LFFIFLPFLDVVEFVRGYLCRLWALFFFLFRQLLCRCSFHLPWHPVDEIGLRVIHLSVLECALILITQEALLVLVSFLLSAIRRAAG